MLHPLKLLGLLVVLLLSSIHTARAQKEPLEFNFGLPNSDHITIFVAQELGLFEKVGLRPKFFTFASGAPLLAGLKSESLDVTSTGLAIMFALGQDIPLKILFWTANDGVGEGLVTTADSGIKSYKDITPATRIGAASGTCAQVALNLMSKKLGIEYSKLNVTNIPAPLFRNSFLSKSIDAGIAWSPHSFVLQGDGFRIVNFDPDYTMPGGICPRLMAVRPAFLKSHPEIGAKLVEVEALAQEAIARNPKLAVDALVKRLSLSEKVAQADYEGIYLKRPTFVQQIDPSSPYSLTTKDGGLAQKLFIAGQALFEAKSIPRPVSLTEIQDAIDASYLQAYAGSREKK